MMNRISWYVFWASGFVVGASINTSDYRIAFGGFFAFILGCILTDLRFIPRGEVTTKADNV